jgi:hypothetical protein
MARLFPPRRPMDANELLDELARLRGALGELGEDGALLV